MTMNLQDSNPRIAKTLSLIAQLSMFVWEMCLHHSTRTYMCVHVCTCVCMCVHVCACVYMCVHVCTCVYMCVHVCTAIGICIVSDLVLM